MKYFSELTNKNYDKVEDLEEAEKAYNEKHKQELAIKEERTAAAKEVEDAYNEYSKAQKEANEKYGVYKDKLSEFLKKYHYYHKTYTTTDTFDKLFDNFFNSFWF